ncbi:MAG: ABC transporter permease [Anaerolineae bacterium]
MLKAILNLAWKELIQLWRDRVLLVFLVIAPMLELALIAQSTGAGIKNQRLAVWDQDRSVLSQQLIQALDNTNEFQLTYRAASFDELHALVNSGQSPVAVIIPPNFARDAARPGVGATVQVIVDGTNVVVANTILNALQGAVGDLTVQFLTAQAPQAPPGGVDLKIDTAFNPTLNVRWSTLTATLAFITYQIVLIVAAVSIVRERELGTIEQLVVTPISRLQLLLGKGLMAAIMGLVDFALLILVLTLGFQLPLRGSLWLLTGMDILFVLAEIGVGMIISLISSNQQQAVLIVFLLAILEITFSGLLVPPENMPAFMQVLGSVSPLQHFTAIVRSVFLKGSTLDMLWGHVIPLVTIGVVTIGAAWTMFSRMEV